MKECALNVRRGMKSKLFLMIAFCIVFTCLTACGQKSAADSYWSAAVKAGSMEEYIREHADSLDVEALKNEADSAESLHIIPV